MKNINELFIFLAGKIGSLPQFLGNKTMVFISLVWLFSTFAPAHADPAPFTIQSAVDQALQRNPDALSAKEAVNQSSATLKYAFSRVLPTLAGTAEADHLKQAPSGNGLALFGGNPYNQYEAAITLTQPIYNGGLSAGYSYSKKDVAVKQYGLDLAVRSLTESILEGFYTVLLDERQLQILKDTYKVDKETLDIAERYYKIGRVQKIDVLQLKTQVALLTPQIAQADDKMRTDAAQLATLLRDLNADKIQLKGSLVIPDYKWVKNELSKKMVQLPEILQAHTLVEQSRDNSDAQLSIYWPTLNVVGQVGRSAYTKTDLIDGNTTSWSIGLQLNVPIFNGLGSIYQRQAYDAAERQVELSETKTSDTVSVSQIQTEKDLDVALTQLESSLEAAKYGKESLLEAQRQYRLQTINYLQYQSSEQAYLTAETGYYQAKYNYIVSVAKYFNAEGVPLSDLVNEMGRLSLNSNNTDTI